MTDLDTPQTDVNSSRLMDVLEFIQNKADSGEIPSGVAGNATTAVRQFAGMLRPDEPDDPAYALDNLEELARRYLNRHPKNNQATTKTYISRFKTVLEHYIAYKKDPLSFRFPVVKERPKREPKATPVETKASEPTNTEAKEAGYKRYPIPLGQGRSDLFVMIPKDDDLAVDDVFRITWALLVHARDFDPRNPQVMSIVRQQGEH